MKCLFFLLLLQPEDDELDEVDDEDDDDEDLLNDFNDSNDDGMIDFYIERLQWMQVFSLLLCKRGLA